MPGDPSDCLHVRRGCSVTRKRGSGKRGMESDMLDSVIVRLQSLSLSLDEW